MRQMLQIVQIVLLMYKHARINSHNYCILTFLASKYVQSNTAAIIRSMLHCRVMRQMLRIVQIVLRMYKHACINSHSLLATWTVSRVLKIEQHVTYEQYSLSLSSSKYTKCPSWTSSPRSKHTKCSSRPSQSQFCCDFSHCVCILHIMMWFHYVAVELFRAANYYHPCYTPTNKTSPPWHIFIAFCVIAHTMCMIFKE